MIVGVLDGIKDCTELYSAVERVVGDDDSRVTDGKVDILDVVDGLRLYTIGFDVDGILDVADAEGKMLGALDCVSLGTVECT